MLPAFDRLLLACGVACLCGLLLVPAGCRRPRAANIELRRENQDLREQVTRLEATNRRLQADVRRLQADHPSVDTLPPDRLDELFTVAGIRLGRLTGQQTLPGERPGVAVYLQPVDEVGDVLKTPGAAVVQVFDLSADDTQGLRLASWEFETADVRASWRSVGLVTGFVLECPWPEGVEVQGRRLTLRVSFTDALTGRTFDTRRDL